MTKEEASMLLEEVLMALAKSAVYSKQLIQHAEDLEKYINELDKKNTDNKDDDKTE